MNFQIPCKQCLVRPMCKEECSSLHVYVKQFDSNRFCWLSLILISLLLILTFILLTYISRWTLFSIPFVWALSFILFIHLSEKNSLIDEPDNFKDVFLSVLFLPHIMILGGLFIRFNTYYEKYSPDGLTLILNKKD